MTTINPGTPLAMRSGGYLQTMDLDTTIVSLGYYFVDSGRKSITKWSSKRHKIKGNTSNITIFYMEGKDHVKM